MRHWLTAVVVFAFLFCVVFLAHGQGCDERYPDTCVTSMKMDANGNHVRRRHRIDKPKKEYPPMWIKVDPPNVLPGPTIKDARAPLRLPMKDVGLVDYIRPVPVIPVQIVKRMPPAYEAGMVKLNDLSLVILLSSGLALCVAFTLKHHRRMWHVYYSVCERIYNALIRICIMVGDYIQSTWRGEQTYESYVCSLLKQLRLDKGAVWRDRGVHGKGHRAIPDEVQPRPVDESAIAVWTRKLRAEDCG